MARAKKNLDKDKLREQRAQLYELIARGELTLQAAVKEMRAISRLTQADFAAHRGVSTKVIKEIESGSGNPTVNTLNRIGSFFGLEVAFVRTETLHRPKQPATSSAMTDKELRTLESVENAWRLSKTLDDLKKLASPSMELQNTLKKMESDLEIIQQSKRLANPTNTLQVELEAVKKAREVINMAEKIQQQIRPPDALAKWMSDLEKIEEVLNPLKKYDFGQKK